jgi:hypothetical protein
MVHVRGLSHLIGFGMKHRAPVRFVQINKKPEKWISADFDDFTSALTTANVHFMQPNSTKVIHRGPRSPTSAASLLDSTKAADASPRLPTRSSAAGVLSSEVTTASGLTLLKLLLIEELDLPSGETLESPTST